MRTLLLHFFYLLYHPFAFTYDLVAAIVSVGRWKDWVLGVVPFIEGTRVLEIGHGPGHLQRVLLSRGLFAVGIDESAPMGRLAYRNLSRYRRIPQKVNPMVSSMDSDYTQIRLTRGLAQHLPFPTACFDTVVATFPAGYIFAPITLEEAYRVLGLDGCFVILPGASIHGRGLIDRVMAFVFRITGETPPNLSEFVLETYKEPLSKAGFAVEFHELEIRSSLVMILVATKTES